MSEPDQDHDGSEDFVKFAEAFERFRTNPVEVSPDVSLHRFQAFWFGYTLRAKSNRAKALFSPTGFHEFVGRNYKNDSTHGAAAIVSLYHRPASAAWGRYFELLDAYLSPEASNTEEVRSSEVTVTFEQLVPAILERPAMYVGNGSFHRIASLFEGWLRASIEMEYMVSGHERRFNSLLRYIEDFDINLPGPSWSAIIWFWTMNDDGARELFSEYFDEFVTQRKGWIQRIESQMERRLKARREA